MSGSYRPSLLDRVSFNSLPEIQTTQLYNRGTKIAPDRRYSSSSDVDCVTNLGIRPLTLNHIAHRTRESHQAKWRLTGFSVLCPVKPGTALDRNALLSLTVPLLQYLDGARPSPMGKKPQIHPSLRIIPTCDMIKTASDRRVGPGRDLRTPRI